jgi:hypothetical protein
MYICICICIYTYVYVYIYIYNIYIIYYILYMIYMFTHTHTLTDAGPTWGTSDSRPATSETKNGKHGRECTLVWMLINNPQPLHHKRRGRWH